MSRDFFINGPALVSVKGRSDSAVMPTLTQLGLSDGQVRVTMNFRHRDMNVDAWGHDIPVDVQVFLTDVIIHLTLIHFDPAVLEECQKQSLGGAATAGQVTGAGTRLGNNLPRFAPGGAAGNNYIGLNLSSPVQGLPWRFWYTYMTGPPVAYVLGTEKSVITTQWRAIPYTQDPWGGGTAQPSTAAGAGSANAVVWDRVLDT